MDITTLPPASDLGEGGAFDSTSVADPHLPLCVDLDGTLIKSDVFFESMLALLKKSPWAIFPLLWWSLRGWSFLKRRVALQVPLRVEMLPYRQEVLEFLQGERESGRRILLVTAADQAVAEAIGNYLGQFDQLFDEKTVFSPIAIPAGQMQSLSGQRAHLMEVVALVGRGKLQINWGFNRNIHARETIQRLAERFLQLLRDLIASSGSAVRASGSMDVDVEGISQEDLAEILDNVAHT